MQIIRLFKSNFATKHIYGTDIFYGIINSE